MRDKNMTITIGISVFLFIFVVAIIYILYCYSYYDESLKMEYVDKFKQRNYDFVYERLDNKDKLKQEDFNRVIDLMYNKNTLEDIYNTYYKDSNIYNNSAEFINEYYYGNKRINIEDIEFLQVGKSSLFKRSKFYYKKINLNNDYNSSALGVIDNITFNIDNNSTLIVDGKRLSCKDNKCLVDYIYLGLHEINYISNGFTYYGIVNISSNLRDINVNSLDNLVNVSFDLETGVNVFDKEL